MKNVILIAGLLIIGLAAKAGTFNMVQINPNTGYCGDLFSDSSKYFYGAGDLKHFARLNGLLYFVGTDQPYNDELWVTDGTQQGTHKVIELNPTDGAQIGDLRVVGNKLMFLANQTCSRFSPTGDWDLFVSDGTAAGTVKTGDLNLQVNTLLSEQSAGVTNGKLIFCSNTDVLVSDGTPTGTKSLAALNIVSYTGANGYCEMNGNVYFIVNSDIWKSDGTVTGTKAVKSIADSANSHWNLAFASFIKAFDNKLYIIGAPSGQGDDLWTFDGTENGVVTKVLSMVGGNTYPGSMTLCAGSLWFTAYDTTSYSLYKLGASASSALRICANVGAMSFAGNKIYYPNADNNGYNVIDAVTNVQSSFGKFGMSMNGSGFSVNGGALLAMGNKVVYTAYDSATSQQVMCITDGTSAGIKVVMPAGVTSVHPFDYTPGCGIIDNFDFTYYDNKVVVPASFNSAGRELWFYEDADLQTGIDESDQISTIRLYPNPTADVITIDLGNAISADLSVQLLDMGGRSISESKMNGNKIELSTSNLANGSYIVSVSKGGEAIARRKLVVAH